jgi:hypothetical protein
LGKSVNGRLKNKTLDAEHLNFTTLSAFSELHTTCASERVPATIESPVFEE